MSRARLILATVLIAGALGGLGWQVSVRAASPAHTHQPSKHAGTRSITDTGVEWPSARQFWRTVTLADYNTRVIFAGVTALGAAGGFVGTFLLLRKRSLLSDTVSHCTLPGITLAFLVAEISGHSGRSLPLLLGGAVVTGVLGMVTVAALRSKSKIKDDAALAIVLSVFFGLGVALLVVVQQMPTGNAAGLKNYIYGKAASMILTDAQTILVASLIVAAVCAAFFKEFQVLCFDVNFARTQGWPVLFLDLVLMALVVAVTVIGLQAVGLLLVVALLIIPPATARFWTNHLGATAWLAALIGAFSGFMGVAFSALFSKLPAGAVIVLAATSCFVGSFIFGTRRGLVMGWVDHRRIKRRVARLHLLRAIYEWCENNPHPDQETGVHLEQSVPLKSLRETNDWSPAQMRSLLRAATGEGLITMETPPEHCRLTGPGRLEARRVTRNHRLWETYLLRYADVAPQHIHHNAHQIEHVIDPNIVNELEELIDGKKTAVPADPERSYVPGGPAR